MRSTRTIFFLLVLSLVSLRVSTLQAQARTTQWSLELLGGTAFSFDTPFTVSQAGQPEITMVAEWDTKPFHAAPYYAYRIARIDTGKHSGWAFDFTHHKIYLGNKPPEIQKFEISHGYNLLVLSKLWQRGHYLWTLGAGPVIGHPENTVRNLAHDDENGGTLGGGYYLCGVVIQGSLGRRIDLGRRFFGSALSKGTAGTCRVPVRDGWAEAPNVAVHVNVGIGVRW